MLARNLLPKTWEKPDEHLMHMLTHPWFSLLAKMQSLVYREATLFFYENQVEALVLPITTGTISSPMGLGSDSLPVSVNLFDQQIYLADSMQFYLELGVCLRPDIKGVWYIMPSFRGEMPDESHLNEFIHLEAEIRGDLNAVMGLVDSLICRFSTRIIDNMSDQVAAISGSLVHLQTVAKSFNPPRVLYKDAVRKLKDNPDCVVMHSAGFPEITRRGEIELMKYCGGPVWLTQHPSLRAPFYQRYDPEEDVALCADLLLGIGETVGSGARQTTGDDVLFALSKREIESKPYQWYIDMKKISPLPTAGFGMGLERFFAWVFQINDIRHMQLLLRQRNIVSLP